MRLQLALVCLVLCYCAAGALGEEPASAVLFVAAASQTAPAGEPESTCWAEEAPESAGPRFLVEADYILYWLKPVCLKPPTLTVGSPTDPQPGVFGQPHTQLVQGGHKFEFKGANGIRPRLGLWLTEDQSLGVEAEGFVLERVAASQDVTTNNGSPATYIVFQNPDNTHAALPLTIPGVVTASSTAVGTTHLWGLETNLACRLPTAGDTWHAVFLAGCRYLHVADSVVVTNRQALVADPSIVAVGQADFATHNQFVGGQVGSRLGATHGALNLDLTTKLAFGETYLVSRVAGSPLLSGQSVLPPLVPGPFLALPSNTGRLSSWRVSVVPEVNLRLRWLLTDQTYLTLGYNLLYWNKVLCPGDQMDSHVNTTQLPFRGPAVGAGVPAPQFVFTDAFAHGIEAGLGFNF